MALLQVTSAVLLASSYVSLCLEDPVEAIRYGEQLINIDSASQPPRSKQASSATPDAFVWMGIVAPPAYRYLAKMYIAEAFIAMEE